MADTVRARLGAMAELDVRFMTRADVAAYHRVTHGSVGYWALAGYLLPCGRGPSPHGGSRRKISLYLARDVERFSPPRRRYPAKP